MENGKEVMKIEAEETLPLVAQDQGLLTEDAIRKVELQVKGLVRIKEISLRLTNKSDWMIMDGKPCLANSGCMKIANLWGVSFHEPTVTVEAITDDKGEYKLFTCSGRAEFRGRTVEDIGTSSTRDKLLGRKAGEFRPLSEVDLPSVKKMSVTNWQSRILKKILGLAFEMDDLVKAGINVQAGYNHAKGGDGGGKISEAQARRLYALAKKGGKTDAQMKAYLSELGIESSKDIPSFPKDIYEDICTWAEDANSAGGQETGE